MCCVIGCRRSSCECALPRDPITEPRLFDCDGSSARSAAAAFLCTRARTQTQRSQLPAHEIRWWELLYTQKEEEQAVLNATTAGQCGVSKKGKVLHAPALPAWEASTDARLMDAHMRLCQCIELLGSTTIHNLQSHHRRLCPSLVRARMRCHLAPCAPRHPSNADWEAQAPHAHTTVAAVAASTFCNALANPEANF